MVLRGIAWKCYTASMTASDIQKRLTKNASQQQALLTEFSRAVGEGDTAKQAALQKQLARLVSEMQRLNDEQQYEQRAARIAPGRPRARVVGKTIREATLDILDEIGVAVSPATIS